MRRDQLEHILRAAAAVSGEREIVVVGAAALLAAVPEPPPELAQTQEADLYPLRRPELADVIDGAIGELSPFHDHFKVYAHGVGPETAVLPAGWDGRLLRVEGPGTSGGVGLCLEPHDLAASKLAAGREKDRAFVEALLGHGLVDPSILGERVAGLPLPLDRRAAIGAWLSGLARRSR